MFIVFVFLLVICSVLACYFIKKGNAHVGASTTIIALCMLIATIAVHYDNIEMGKVEALKSAGIEPLSTTQVYNMSKKELDECKVVYTFCRTYYFEDETTKSKIATKK